MREEWSRVERQQPSRQQGDEKPEREDDVDG